jgi:beta-1,4-mannosyl-glycoprotein beta-1,4-N-acetylglucosaminyltransferase
MIIDCFPFFNELDVLELRLNTLNEYVDYFVLVEASMTQSLKAKPFYFEQNKERYGKFLSKIIHVKIEDYPNTGGWAMENYQRNCILEGLKKINPKNEDIILISDADEIPDLECINLEDLKNNIVSFRMTYHTFYTNLITENKDWIGTVSAPYKNILEKSPQFFRNNKDFFENRIYAGWHLGYMGGKEKVYQKFLSCIEPIDKSLIPDYETFSINFDKKIKDNGSFLFSDKDDSSIKLIKIDINYPNLPNYLVENQLKFKNLIID